MIILYITSTRVPAPRGSWYRMVHGTEIHPQISVPQCTKFSTEIAVQKFSAGTGDLGEDRDRFEGLLVGVPKAVPVLC